jgi:hypothetical protein
MAMRRDKKFTRKVIRACLPFKVGVTIDELVALSGYTDTCCNYVLKEFRAAGRAYIIGWRADLCVDGYRTGKPKALYARGKGKDAPRPAPLPKSIIKRRHLDRKARMKQTNAFNILVSQ